MFVPSYATVPKMQTVEDLQGDALLHYDAKFELMNLILLSIPNDIYNSVDACTSAKDMWKRVECLMRELYKTKLIEKLQFEKLVNTSRAKKLEKSHDPLALVAHMGSSSRNTSSYYVTHPTFVVDYDDEYQQDDIQTNYKDPLTSAMLLLARAITKNFSNPTYNCLRTSSNTKNQVVIQGDHVNIQSMNSGNAGRNNRRAYVQEEVVEGSNETGNVQRTIWNSSLGNTSTVQYYNYSRKEHYARKCPKLIVWDSKYFMEQMLLAKQDESVVILTDGQNDFLFADASRMEEIKDLSANICLMARIQPTNHSFDVGPSYDNAFVSKVQSSSINKNEEQMYPTHTNIINNTIGDDQIDIIIIFDTPNGNLNSGSVKKDTYVPNLYALEQLARNAYQEAEKQQIFLKKGKSVNTKFNTTNGFQTPLCVTPINKHTFQKKMDVPKIEENHVVSKPVTLQTPPDKQTGVNSNKNVIASGMYKVVTPQETQNSKSGLSSTGMNAASSVKRSMNRDSHDKNSVLAHSKNSTNQVAVYVTKNKQTDNTFVNVISNKENVVDVDVATASKAKNLLCVSCMQNVLILCHDKCLAHHRLNASRTLTTKSRTPKSLDTAYVVLKTRFSKKSTQSKTLDTTFVVSKSKIDVGSASKAKNKVVQIVLWIVDSGCLKHMMGDRSLLRNFIRKFMGTVRFRNDNFAAITGYGDYIQGNITIFHVYYVEGLGHNLSSVGQFYDGRKSNLYTISISDMAASSPVCLMSKATSTKSWLWHHRLSHINFGAINDLIGLDLVDDLPKFKYEKDHLCSACERGKRNKASHPSNLVSSDNSKMELLHMDLCSLMRVASINGKKHILVIVDDYSQYTWFYFLHSKDETPEIIKKFIAQAQLNYKTKVCKIRTDNGTEFKNATLKAHYEKLGIMQQFSTAHTPQQNGVVERRNQYYRKKSSDTPINSTTQPTQLHEDSPSISSITIDEHEAPSIETTSDEQTSLITLTEANELHQEDSANFDGNSQFVTYNPLSYEAIESSLTALEPSNVQNFHQVQPSTHSWTKDHPLDQVIGDPSKPVMTHQRLHTDPEVCMYALTVSTIEPKNIKEALANHSWIDSMLEEGIDFEESFCPVARLEAVRIQPEGFIDLEFPNHVYRLKKALYGLKQSPHTWYDKLSSFLIKHGFTKGGKLMSWSFKKQDCTAMSTTEAIYLSLSVCCAQVIWMRTQLLDYGYKYNWISMYCDSKSAISISCNLVQHSKTKHIAIRYHFIKEPVEKGTVEINFVSTEYQLVDLFTKVLPKERFEYLVHRIVIIMAHQQLVADVHLDEMCPPNKRKELSLTLDDFKIIFHLPQATNNNHDSFVPPPSFYDMIPLYKNNLGFTMELKTLSSFKTTGLLQPWQKLCKIFSKCLTTLVIGWDQPPLQIMQMLYCFINNIHVDYAELL
uniref:Integrase catalytic domain-containing protein n=1 Tax=Tanacetum cinerariifolium TaxID=118510 RepID=A0A6L2K9D8_TANCI|nr:hypothetical protein [Tanacetum cinerariifolium]